MDRDAHGRLLTGAEARRRARWISMPVAVLPAASSVARNEISGVASVMPSPPSSQDRGGETDRAPKTHQLVADLQEPERLAPVDVERHPRDEARLIGSRYSTAPTTSSSLTGRPSGKLAPMRSTISSTETPACSAFQAVSERPIPVVGHEPGTHAVRGHAIGRELDRQRLDQPDQPELRGGVGLDPRVAALAGVGRDRDDAAATARAQRRRRRPAPRGTRP